MNTFKKLFISILTLSFIGIAVYGASNSFFSNSEKSSGNTFIAGAIDLKVDNECRYNGRICKESPTAAGSYVWYDQSGLPTIEPCACSWTVAQDLDGKAIFSFADIKPGDTGEDTISLHVDTNPAWVCAEISNLTQKDNGCDTPELKAEQAVYGIGNETCGTGEAGLNQGELQKNLLFSVWIDDGAGGGTACDNIKNGSETYLAENVPVTEITYPIADSSTVGGPIQDACIGISWSVPKTIGNIIQTDSLTGDITFTAIQSRNNTNFRCIALPTGEPTPVISPILTPEPTATPEPIPTATPTSAPSAWAHSATITVDHTKISGTENLADFTFNFVGIYNGDGGEPDLRSVANSGHMTNNDGYDIGFFADVALTMPLTYERELHNTVTGEVIYWIKIPSLSYSANTVIYMAYGNSGITTDQSNANGTWDGNYIGVWHMDEDPSGSAPQIMNSKSNNHNGTSGGSMISSDLVAGKIGNAINFDGVNDVITVPHDSALNAYPITISFWIKTTDTGQYHGMISKYTAGSYNGYLIDFSGGTPHGWYIVDGSNNTIDSTAGALSDGNWHYLTMTTDASGTKWYNDGNTTPSGSKPWTGTPQVCTSSTDLTFAQYVGNLSGSLDEIRISNTSRSTSWLNAEYNNQSSPATFYTVGPEI